MFFFEKFLKDCLVIALLRAYNDALHEGSEGFVIFHGQNMLCRGDTPLRHLLEVDEEGREGACRADFVARPQGCMQIIQVRIRLWFELSTSRLHLELRLLGLIICSCRHNLTSRNYYYI